MKTISETQNKNLNMEVKGDFYQYPDGTDFVVQDGKMAPTAGPSSGGTLVVHATGEDDGYGTIIYTLDKTAGEIIAAARIGHVVCDMYNGFAEPSAVLPLIDAHFDSRGNKYYFYFGDTKSMAGFIAGAETENDYPVTEGGK